MRFTRKIIAMGLWCFERKAEQRIENIHGDGIEVNEEDFGAELVLLEANWTSYSFVAWNFPRKLIKSSTTSAICFQNLNVLLKTGNLPV